MAQNDTDPAFEIGDVASALGLLSRLPVPVDGHHAQTRSSKAVWAYPIAGAIIGLIAGLIGVVAHWLGLPAMAVAALMVATTAIVTGAMHEDGLADSFDGLWGGWDKSRRLEIMKDSHIGVYGVLAIGLSLVLRISLLAALVGSVNLLVLGVLLGAISRAPMVGVMHWLANARDTGLSASVGPAPRDQTYIAIAFGVVLALFGTGLISLLLVSITAILWAAIAKSKIGGQTGDILGATQQLCEIATLIGLCIISV